MFCLGSHFQPKKTLLTLLRLGEVVKYEIWDTAGQERYKSLVWGQPRGRSSETEAGVCSFVPGVLFSSLAHQVW